MNLTTVSQDIMFSLPNDMSIIIIKKKDNWKKLSIWIFVINNLNYPYLPEVHYFRVPPLYINIF